MHKTILDKKETRQISHLGACPPNNGQQTTFPKESGG
jgi:hypothetical protein